MEKLRRILDPNKVVLNLAAQRNFDAIRELATVLCQDEVVPDQKHLARGLDSARATGFYGHWQGGGPCPMHTRMGSSASFWPSASRRMALTLVRPTASPSTSSRCWSRLSNIKNSTWRCWRPLSQRLQQEEVRQRLLQAADAAEVVDIFTGNPPPG